MRFSYFHFRSNLFCILGWYILICLILFWTFFFTILVLRLTLLFSCSRFLCKNINTFVVLVDVLNYNFLFSLFLLECICCIWYSVWLVERLGLFFIVGMFSWCASWKFLELIPIIYYFVATSPAFFKVVEDGLTWVKIASSLGVILLVVVFETTVTSTSFLTFCLHFEYYINLSRILY